MLRCRLPARRRGPPLQRRRKVDRIAAREAVQIQPAREAEGIFLRKTPDRRAIVPARRCRCQPLRCLAARLRPCLVVKTRLDPDAGFQGRWRLMGPRAKRPDREVVSERTEREVHVIASHCDGRIAARCW